MTSLAVSILWCALQVSLFLFLAAPVYLAARRRNPRLGTLTAATCLVVVIALSALAASPWPRWSWGADQEALNTHDRPQIAFSTGDIAAPVASAPTAVRPGELHAPKSAIPPSPSTLQIVWNALQTAAVPAMAPGDPSPARWPTVIAVVAMIGAAVSAVRLTAGLWTVRWLVQRSRPLNDGELSSKLARIKGRLNIASPVELRESDEMVTPATVGWRRPVILLPRSWASWNSVEQESVLAHELAHVARRDFAAALLGRLAIAIHFYHPLVRWFAGQMQLDQELAADAAAARLVGSRDVYLRALANLALATPAHRLAGPVRTLVPSRSLLIRRIEMLRTNNISRLTAPRGSRLAKWTAGGILAALAIGAAGIRPPAGAPLQAAEPQTDEAAPVAEDGAQGAKGYDFSYLPNDFIAMFAIRPSEMASSPRLKQLADTLDKLMRPGIPTSSLEQVTAVMPAPRRDDRGHMLPGSGGEYTVFRTTVPTNFKPLIAESYGEIDVARQNGHELMTWHDSEYVIAFHAPNDRTLVSTPKAALLRMVDDPGFADPPPGVDRWRDEASGPVFAVLNVKALRETMGGQLAGGPPLQMFWPILESAEWAFMSIDDAEPLVLRAKIVCRTAEEAAKIEPTVQSAVVLVGNVIEAQKAAVARHPAGSPQGALEQAMLKQFEMAAQVIKSVKIERDGESLLLTASIVDAPSIIATVTPQIFAAREAAQRVQGQNNLKQLSLAALVYHDRFDSFPPAVVYGKSAYGDLNTSGDNVQDVPRSWRVELLPLLGEEVLYKLYRLDEPWDSEANQAVLRNTPAVFRSPHDMPGSTNASYFALTGPTTIFDGKEGTKLQEITDGTSNTMLFVEAKRPTPWTKPEDIPYYADKPLPKLGGWRPGEFLVAICDGSVLSVQDADELDADVLRPWIEKADGQVAPPLNEARGVRPAP